MATERTEPVNPRATRDSDPTPVIQPATLRKTVLLVAGINLAYFFVEIAVALQIGSVSLFADSVDFLEDTAVNVLIALALGLPLSRRAKAGRVMALIILAPAVAAIVTAVQKFQNPVPPEVVSLVATAGGAIVVNAACALILQRIRHAGGSMTAAAFLAARNDVAANAAIILMGLLTWATRSGWPDIMLGLVIIALNTSAAKEVWELAGAEELAARALSGEEIDDD